VHERRSLALGDGVEHGGDLVVARDLTVADGEVDPPHAQVLEEPAVDVDVVLGPEVDDGRHAVLGQRAVRGGALGVPAPPDPVVDDPEVVDPLDPVGLGRRGGGVELPGADDQEVADDQEAQEPGQDPQEDAGHPTHRRSAGLLPHLRLLVHSWFLGRIGWRMEGKSERGLVRGGLDQPLAR
jgi:hypothetical protein